MEKLSIADFFKKEMGIKHNTEKIKKIQENNKDSYYIKCEKQINGREGLSLYYDGDKGLKDFLEDYLELFDPNIASAQNTVIAVDGKIRDLINNSQGNKDKPNIDNRKVKKYSVEEIRTMYSEFAKLSDKYLPLINEIERWQELQKIFIK